MAFRADCLDLSCYKRYQMRIRAATRANATQGGRRAFWGHTGAVQSLWFSSRRNLLLMPLILTNTVRKAIAKQ